VVVVVVSVVELLVVAGVAVDGVVVVLSGATGVTTVLVAVVDVLVLVEVEVEVAGVSLETQAARDKASVAPAQIMVKSL
jgi:hypothetical protein